MPSANDNPFRSERIDAIPYRLTGTTWGELFGKLESLHYRAAIVGPHGGGKTTLLDTLVPMLEDRFPRIVRIMLTSSSLAPTRLEHRAILGSSKDTLIVLDGAEQLPWFSWQMLRLHSGRAGGLLITTHESGRLPTLIECRPTVQMTMELIDTLAPGQIGTARVEQLFTKHDGNIRAVFRELYDDHAHS